MRPNLEAELFPSGRSVDSLGSFDRSQQPRSSSFQAVAPIDDDPWSQTSAKATQYLRDEWLISAGQKQPTDLVEDHVRARKRDLYMGIEPSFQEGSWGSIDIHISSSTYNAATDDEPAHSQAKPFQPARTARRNLQFFSQQFRRTKKDDAPQRSSQESVTETIRAVARRKATSTTSLMQPAKSERTASTSAWKGKGRECDVNAQSDGRSWSTAGACHEHTNQLYRLGHARRYRRVRGRRPSQHV